jgi:hypothetical protein
MLTNVNASSAIAEKQAQDLMLQVHSLQVIEKIRFNTVIVDLV